MSYRTDSTIIDQYCHHGGNVLSLRDLSFQALEIFLKEARSLPDSVKRTAKIIKDLEGARRSKLTACLGKSVISKIDREFSKHISIVSWNVNGIRSRIVDNKTSQKQPKKGKSFICRAILSDSPLSKVMRNSVINAQVICLQETKITGAMEKIFTGPSQQCGWTSFWSSSEPPNYAGVTTWVRADISPGSRHVSGFPQRILDQLSDSAKHRIDTYIRTKTQNGLENAGSHPLVNEGRISVVFLPVVKLIVVNTYVPNTQSAGFTSQKSVKYLREQRELGISLPSSTAFES